MCALFLLSSPASLTHRITTTSTRSREGRGRHGRAPASVLFRTAGDHARHAPLAVCWTGAASVVFRFGGSRTPCPAGCLLDGCGVRCLPVSGDHARHAPLAVCWTGAASVAFRFRGTRPAMPARVRPGVKVLPSRGRR